MFAGENIDRNKLVARFFGEEIDIETEYLERYDAGRGGYAVALGKGKVLDCFDNARMGLCKASMANDIQLIKIIIVLKSGE